MDDRSTLRQRIDNRDVLDTISTPQRVCLGVTAFGGIALIAVLAYTMTMMS